MKKKYIHKRFLSIAMAVMLAASMVPVTSLAYENEEPVQVDSSVTAFLEEVDQNENTTEAISEEAVQDNNPVEATSEGENQDENPIEAISEEEVQDENPVEVISEETEDIDTNWYNTSDTEFVLTTAAQLKGFAAIVNGTAEDIAQDNFAGKTVTLGNSIALADDGLYNTVAEVVYGDPGFPMKTTQYVLTKEATIWTPIGSGTATGNTNATTTNAFAGTFDGQGYTISGVYTGTKDATAGNTDTVQGLFGVVTGAIKNVTVSGCITAKMVAGGIVAHLAGGTVVNCTNNAVVFIDGGTTPNGNVENGLSRVGAVGGIVGNAMTGSTVTDCTNNGAVTCANTNRGGRTGGIVGLIDGATDVVIITRNGNNGKIESYQYGGGIVGVNFSGVSPISECYNNGAVTGYSPGSTYEGGITSQCKSNISYCYNTGSIAIYNSGKSAHLGGIVSDFSGTEVSNCYNLGEILTPGSSYGQICGTGYGSAANNKLTNCYGLEGLVGEDVDNRCVITKKADEMIKADFVSALNGEEGIAFVAVECSAINNGYPVLAWQNSEHTIVKGSCTACESLLWTPGDVNDDGNVNLKDIILLQQYIVGGYDVTINENAAEVSDDEAISVKDVILIQQYVAKIIAEL